MKLIGLSFVMAGLLLTACRKPVAQTEDTLAPQPVATTQAPSLSPAQTASPTRTETVPPTLTQTTRLIDAPAPAPLRELAPPGVFYLLVSVRKDTKDGVVRLLPGTEVRLGKNGKFITPEGEMTLDPGILTNDMAKARVVRRADKLAQATGYPQGLSAISAAPNTSVPPPAPTRALPPTPDPLAALFSATPAPQADNANVRALKFRLSVLKSDEAKLQANMDFLSDKALHPYRSGRVAPAGLNSTTNLTDWNLVSDKLAAVRAEIQSLEAKLGVAAN
ncbi:hypothetical protein CfE428DRAFT_1396 [Chthoniobacter flavus Ellin428]|uniref:Lipoprotein n=1 Tax=Chthoniobacter flavus Ellin428 TaxID=497964 RepID=B4CXV5_9BACT|nr:hypothetical protein [Chthoniobacter flavus]EDY21103.1 hypothetical protein CfE428DRAFT_1396 [Chthoniobacter flavus Ellin428]TCO83599.1 hypothetical protein EV701_14110 [Chthoniobacter flavus]